MNTTSSITINALAALLEASIDGLSEQERLVEIHGVNTIQDAQRGELTFLTNPKYVQYLATTQASCVLVAQGVGVWMGFQSFINIGVNLGALPTKGLTLPLMSYGGSAILINLVALAIVLRVDYENRLLMRGGPA